MRKLFISVLAFASFVIAGCQKNNDDGIPAISSYFPVFIVDQNGNDLLNPANENYIERIEIHLVHDNNYSRFTDKEERDTIIIIGESVINYAKDAVKYGIQDKISEWLVKCPFAMYNCIYPFGPLFCVKEAVISYDVPGLKPDTILFEMNNNGSKAPYVKHVTLNGVLDERIVMFESFPDYYLAIVKDISESNIP